MIELRNISKIFHLKGRTISALSSVSLTVPEGKIMGVIGESGAGKSTLIRCVNLLERPNNGEVYVAGQDLMKLSPSQLAIARRNIGMIFQHFNLLSSRTVFDNIAFPLELVGTSKVNIKSRVLQLLKLVGLEDKAQDYPSKLSGGQKQRVAIARTLACNPKILLCDEATSALDPATTRSILALLKDINKKLNITILLITHEMEVIKEICDEVAVLSDGKLIECGTIAGIFSHPEHALTKKFVESSIQVNIPLDYQIRLSNKAGEGKHFLIKLIISGQSVANASLSEVAREFHVNSNIVCAQMDHVGGAKFGVMLIELIGAVGKEQEIISFLEKKNIKIETLGYV